MKITVSRILNRVRRDSRRLARVVRNGGVTYANIVQVHHGNILRGRRVLVTGGGSGIGFAIASKCLSEGARVVITGRSMERLGAAAARLDHSDLQILRWDVSDISVAEERIEEAARLLEGPIEVLVNNAGVLFAEVGFPNVTEGIGIRPTQRTRRDYFSSPSISVRCGWIVVRAERFSISRLPGDFW